MRPKINFVDFLGGEEEEEGGEDEEEGAGEEKEGREEARLGQASRRVLAPWSSVAKVLAKCCESLFLIQKYRAKNKTPAMKLHLLEGPPLQIVWEKKGPKSEECLLLNVK